MKKVSLRDFQLRPSDYLDKLPIVLTRYGKEVAVVHPRETIEEITRAAEEIASEVFGTRRGFCKGHFEKGVEYDLKKVAYEDVNGAEAEPKWLCPDCIKKMEGEVKRNGGRIIYK